MLVDFVGILSFIT